jgi:hypothetical protein
MCLYIIIIIIIIIIIMSWRFRGKKFNKILSDNQPR